MWRALDFHMCCSLLLLDQQRTGRQEGKSQACERRRLQFDVHVIHYHTYDFPPLKSHLDGCLHSYLQHCGQLWLVSVINTNDRIPGEKLQRCIIHLVYRTPEPASSPWQPIADHIWIMQRPIFLHPLPHTQAHFSSSLSI